MDDKLLVQGIDSMGYGTVSKLAMWDRRLSIEAKGIYAYFCSYAGGGSTEVFPSVEKMCYDLNVSEKRLRRYRDELVAFGYISIKQVKVDGKSYNRNVYELQREINMDGHRDQSEFSKPNQKQDNFTTCQNDGVSNQQGVETTGCQFDSNNINSSFNKNIYINKNIKERDKATPDDAYSKVINHIRENRLFKIYDVHTGKIINLVDTYLDADLIIEAFERSKASGNQIAYASSILRNWKEQSILNKQHLEEVEAANRKAATSYGKQKSVPRSERKSGFEDILGF